MNIKLTSRFKPFTFDEMVKPLQNYKEAYDKVEEQYGELSEKTEMWKDIADKTNSPEAYAMYKKYSDELRSVTDDFATGMTMQNRSQLLGMRRRYASEIIPIENAKKAFDKMIETREKISAGDDSAIFVNQYNSLDDFLHGGVADNTYISGNKLMERVAMKCEAYGKSEYGKMQLDRAGLSRGYQDLWVQKNGYSMADLQQVLDKAPNTQAAKDIQMIINSELNAVGYQKLNDYDKGRLNSYATDGAYRGLSNPQYHFVDSGLAHAQNYEMENKRLAEEVRAHKASESLRAKELQQSNAHFWAQLRQSDRHHKDQMRAARHSNSSKSSSSYAQKEAAMIDLIASGKATEEQAKKLIFGTQKEKIEAAKQLASGAGGIEAALNYEHAVNNPASEETLKKLNVKVGHGGLNVTGTGVWGIGSGRKVVSSTLSPQAYYDTKNKKGDDGRGSWDQWYSIGNFGKDKNGKYIYLGGGVHPNRNYKRLTWDQVKSKYPEDASAIRSHFSSYGDNPANYNWAKAGGSYLFDDARKYPTGYHWDAPEVRTSKPKVVAGKKTSGRKAVSK